MSVHRDDEWTTLGYFALASLFENFMRTVKPRRIKQALSVRRNDERTTVGHGAIWFDKSDVLTERPCRKYFYLNYVSMLDSYPPPLMEVVTIDDKIFT